MGDVSDLDLQAFADAVAAETGVSSTAVEVASVDYKVESKYEVATEVSEDQAQTAIATANKVPKDSVTIIFDSNRRVRRLSSGTSFIAIVKTSSPAVAAA